MHPRNMTDRELIDSAHNSFCDTCQEIAVRHGDDIVDYGAFPVNYALRAELSRLYDIEDSLQSLEASFEDRMEHVTGFTGDGTDFW